MGEQSQQIDNKPSVTIFGAGSTDCYLGALLSLAGLNGSLIARPRI